jgi:hypothetical protein
MALVYLYNHRPGHDDSCIVNFGASERVCDCGAFAATEKLRKEQVAAILACNHEFVGFRSSKLCKHCGKIRAELKELK